jgi:uncharacterized protein YcsI (UPF0317 family)
MVRRGEWTEKTSVAPYPCKGHGRANLAIVPRESAFEFLLFCNRNPRPCPVLEVTDPGDPHTRVVSPEADLRTDVPRYRVFVNGSLTDECTDVVKYWRDDLVAFLIGCSCTIEQALVAAGLTWRVYGAYKSDIACTSAGAFHGHMVVTARGFRSPREAIRAVQISSRHVASHGAPVHVGGPEKIGIHDLGKPDPFLRQLEAGPPAPDETILYWGCGITPQTVALESKVPFMITHSPAHMFVMDETAEQLAVL